MSEGEVEIEIQSLNAIRTWVRALCERVREVSDLANLTLIDNLQFLPLENIQQQGALQSRAFTEQSMAEMLLWLQSSCSSFGQLTWDKAG